MEYFHFAERLIAEKDAKGLAKLLQQRRELAFRKDDFGNSLLHEAALLNRAKCIDVLMKFGADADSCDIGGQTPLQNAAWFGNLAAVKALVKHGAVFCDVLNHLIGARETRAPFHLLPQQAEIIEYLKKVQRLARKDKKRPKSKHCLSITSAQNRIAEI